MESEQSRNQNIVCNYLKQCFFTRMSFACHSCVLACQPYVTRLCSFIICSTRMSFVCHSCVFICYLYVNRMYSYLHTCHSYVHTYNSFFTPMYLYVIGIYQYAIHISLGCTGMLSVWQSYVAVCHPL